MKELPLKRIKTNCADVSYIFISMWQFSKCIVERNLGICFRIFAIYKLLYSVLFFSGGCFSGETSGVTERKAMYNNTKHRGL